jgi:hypothetical protein
MRLVTPEPFDGLRAAAQLLQRFRHVKEAQAFLELRVRAVPWDHSARTELAALTGNAAELREIASDAQAPYSDRAKAASELTGVNGLGSQELDLLASGQPIAPAAAERPYFFWARTKASAEVDIRVRLLRGALAIRPESVSARSALFQALRETGAHTAATGVFEPLLKNTMGGWLNAAPSGEPGEWVANSFLREYPNRAQIASQLVDSYRRTGRLGTARALLLIAKRVDPGAVGQSDLDAIESALTRQRENQSRRPQIHDGLEQTVRVRPRLVAQGGAR